MIASRQKALAVGILIGLIFIFICAYTVVEGQRALLLRLGNIVLTPDGKQAAVVGPGLHFRLPLLYQVYKFDVRVQTLDIQSSRIVTAEKKDVLVDYYVKWRINNPALYFTRTSGSSQKAELLLTQQLNDSLRAEFGRRSISDVISDDRVNIMSALNHQANINAQRLGVEVVDVRIKRIDLPTEVSAAVFDRMRAERERVAAEHRAQGKARAEAIRANADASATVIIATAKADAAKMRGEGDAQAGKIYADAYSNEPKFYLFYRSLIAYRQTFEGKNDIFIVKPEGEFFKYFHGANAETSAKK